MAPWPRIARELIRAHVPVTGESVKNQFEKALQSKKADRAKHAAKQGGGKSGAFDQLHERTEAVKNGKVLSSTRADKK